MQCLNGIGKRFEEPGEGASSSTTPPAAAFPSPHPQGVGPRSSPGEHLAGTFSRKSWSNDSIVLCPLADPLGLVGTHTRTPLQAPPPDMLLGPSLRAGKGRQLHGRLGRAAPRPSGRSLVGSGPVQRRFLLLWHRRARPLGLPTLLFTWALPGLGHMHGTCLPPSVTLPRGAVAKGPAPQSGIQTAAQSAPGLRGVSLGRYGLSAVPTEAPGLPSSRQLLGCQTTSSAFQTVHQLSVRAGGSGLARLWAGRKSFVQIWNHTHSSRPAWKPDLPTLTFTGPRWRPGAEEPTWGQPWGLT